MKDKKKAKKVIDEAAAEIRKPRPKRFSQDTVADPVRIEGDVVHI